MKNILIKTLSRLLKCHCRQKWSDCPFCFLSTKIQIKAFERKQNPKQDVTTAQKSHLKTHLVSHTGGYLPVHEDDDQHWQDDDSCSCPQTDLSSQWDSRQQRVAVVLNQSQVHLQVSHENLTEDMQTESEKGWVWEWVNHWPSYTNRAGKSLKSISALDMNPCKSQQLKTKDHLEARKFMAVIHTEWLDLWRVTVQVSTVQSFHVTLLISKPSLHFLFGHGSGQVLALTDKKRQKRRLNLNLFRLHGSGFTYDSCCTSTAITPPGLKRNGTSRFSRLIGNKTGFG